MCGYFVVLEQIMEFACIVAMPNLLLAWILHLPA